MKKLISILLAVMLVLSLSACSGGTTEENTNTENVTEQIKEENNETEARDENVASDSKALIVYFSWSSNTETMANYIQAATGFDIEHIEPVNAYPEDYQDTADLAKAERDNGERPEFKELQYDPEEYDTVFIGYPIWWYELPMIMRTFFDTYDFSGKTIVPFNTHAGSGNGGTYEQIKELEPNATVLEGLPIAGSDINSADSNEKVLDWLDGLGY